MEHVDGVDDGSHTELAPLFWKRTPLRVFTETVDLIGVSFPGPRRCWEIPEVCVNQLAIITLGIIFAPADKEKLSAPAVFTQSNSLGRRARPGWWDGSGRTGWVGVMSRAGGWVEQAGLDCAILLCASCDSCGAVPQSL